MTSIIETHPGGIPPTIVDQATPPAIEPGTLSFPPVTETLTRNEQFLLEGVFQTLPTMFDEGTPTVTMDILRTARSMQNKKTSPLVLPEHEEENTDNNAQSLGTRVFRKIERDAQNHKWNAVFTTPDDDTLEKYPVDRVRLHHPSRTNTTAVQGTLEGIPLEAIQVRQLRFDNPELHPSESKPEAISGKFAGKDIVSIGQFDPYSLDIVFRLADKMAVISQGAINSDVLRGSQVNLSFYEPSTRTHDSFETAIQQLGAAAYGSPSPKDFSSVTKGETLHDSMKTVGAYGDAIVLRHPDIGAAMEAAKAATTVPVINAGDGIGEHPTQALLDLYTIKKETGRLGNLNVVMMGDILNGRTIHSLIEGLGMYEGNRFTLMSPDILRLPPTMLNKLQRKGLMINEVKSPDDMPQQSDVWYVTRIQKERFRHAADYEKVKGSYVVNNDFIRRYASSDTVIMHPMPRNDEIPREVDSDPRAAYFRQSRNGQYVRMALMALVLGKITTEQVLSGNVHL